MSVSTRVDTKRNQTNLQLEAGATATVDGATHTVVDGPVHPASFIGRVRLTAVNAGAPTLDVVIQDSFDGTNWNTLITFAQLTGTGEEIVAAARAPGPFLRSRATIGGTTPDIDFRVDALGAELRA